jgi:heme/copper-type cytochrome/quinol oxidase subunit 4
MNLRKALRPILIFFAGVNIVAASLYLTLKNMGLDTDVFLVGNLFICILTLVSFWMMHNGLQSKSTAGFMSSVYGSFIIKLVLAALVVVAYAQWKGNAMNTPALLSSMFTYLVYTYLEVKGLLALVKKD